MSRPDGKKKAYVRLTSDHDALDVANKVFPPFVLYSGNLYQNFTSDWLHLRLNAQRQCVHVCMYPNSMSSPFRI